MRTLRTLAITALLAALGCLPARAQFLGYTLPQSVTQTLATAATCTGSNQVYNVQNLGQTVHFATFASGVGNTSFAAYIQGVTSSGAVVVISDVVTPNTSIGAFSVSATGYYAQVQIVVACTGNGQYQIDYLGTSSTDPITQGSLLSNHIGKALAAGFIPSGVGAASGITFAPPYGSTAGYLSLQNVTAAGPAGSTITVQCLSAAVSGSPLTSTQTWTPATTVTVLQIFPVAVQSCPAVAAIYTAGAASTAHVFLTYVFEPTGEPEQFAYSNISTNTNTQLKTGPGKLHAITVNAPGTTATATLFDNTSCAGTKIGTVTVAAAQPLVFDATFNTGLCITTAGAPDLTVSFN